MSSAGDVLDELTFWRIVRTEKERADRSGVPVTVAIFTVRDEAAGTDAMVGWNAAAMCSLLRSTARITDHVGIAGENELGVILWGTRELGAYRFVNRLGVKGERLSADCRLFVYPTIESPEPQHPANDLDNLLASARRPIDNGILGRIAEVEQKLSEALGVETPVVKVEDCADGDEQFGFGRDEPDFAANQPERSSSTGLDGSIGSTATNSSAVDTLAPPLPKRVVEESAQRPAADGEFKMSVVIEPLENLFMFPHPAWKRCVDIVGAAFGLVVLSPLMAAAALAIKLTSPGPILFRQTREGHGGKLFTILKFRTMRIGADAEQATLKAANEQHGPAFKMAHDPRTTPIGRFLRRTCLDELPQLWNVLLGDMTLVGPRPLDFRESTQIARWGRRRLMVKPGLTCIWQVHGKSRVSFNEWMRMDIRYSQRISFWNDAKLMAATLKQMILRQASH